MKKLLNYLSPNNFKNDTLSGATVALALVPEAIAFAFVAKVNPMVGLFAACIVSLVTGLLSGRPGMISGATGALAVAMTALVVGHGVQYLFAAVVLMGIMQAIIGVCKLGKFSRIIPHPVMLGFVNGLAIIIFLAQIPQFQSLTPAGHWGWISGTWHAPAILIPMLLITGITMGIIHFLPKLTKAVPSSLVAIVFGTLAVQLLNIDTPTVLDMLKGVNLEAKLPDFAIPQVPLNLETLKIIFPYAIVFALIGLIESLMTLSLIDEITDTRGQSNKECIAQGAANIASGFFGTMGGCAMVGQSMININSGGRGRWSGIVAGALLLALILFSATYIQMIPLAVLIGVMFMVVIGTFAWSSIRLIKKIPAADAAVLIIVSVVTIFTDLAVAVILGIIISALNFSWQRAENIALTSTTDKKGIKHYAANGILFFASTKHFTESFDVKNDPEVVQLDFKEARILDHSGIEAVSALSKKYKTAGKILHLYHLSPDCQKLLKKLGDTIHVNKSQDPVYEVADNALDA